MSIQSQGPAGRWVVMWNSRKQAAQSEVENKYADDHMLEYTTQLLTPRIGSKQMASCSSGTTKTKR